MENEKDLLDSIGLTYDEDLASVGLDTQSAPVDTQTIGVGETTPEGFILGPDMKKEQGTIVDIQAEKKATEAAAAAAKTAALQKGKQQGDFWKNPETGKIEVSPEQGLEDTSLDFMDYLIPALGASSAVVGALMPVMTRDTKRKIAKDVANAPEIMSDILDAVKFAKDRNIPISQEMYRGETGQVITGNMHVDKLFGNIYKKYPQVEYDTITSIIDNVSRNPKSINEIAEAFQSQLDTAYQKYDSIETASWDKFKTAMKNESVSAAGNPFTYNTKELFASIDEALGEADATVSDFIQRTLIAGSQGGKLQISSLRGELSDVVNELKTYDTKKLTAYEKGRVRRLTVKKAQLQKDIAKADIDVKNAPATLSMEQLITASQLLSNKVHVKGGAINTNNLLEKRHIMAAKEKIDEYIAQNLSPDTLTYLQEAKAASKKKYDTFGYNLSGKNTGIRTDVNGNILKVGEADRVSLVQQEIFSSDPAYALVKMKKYEEHITPDLLDSIKREYLANVMNMSKEFITDKTRHIGLEVDDKTFQASLIKMTETSDGRELSKYILGKDGFSDLIALKELNKAIKSRLPNGDFGYLDQLADAYKEGSNAFTGSVRALLKLSKGLTWDIVNMPYHLIQGRKFNRQFAAEITKDLRKTGYLDEAKLAKNVSQWEAEMRRAGASTSNIETMNKMAGGGFEPEDINGYGIQTIKFSDKSKGVIIDNMDGTISLDLFGIKETGKGYGTQIVEKAIKENPGKKIFVDSDMRGNSPQFFEKMRKKYPGKFEFEDASMISTVGGLSTVAVALGMSPSNANAKEEKIEAPKNEELFNSIHSIIIGNQYDTINKIKHTMPRLRQGEAEAYIAYDLYKLINTKQYDKVKEYAKKANIPIEDFQDLLPTK